MTATTTSSFILPGQPLPSLPGKPSTSSSTTIDPPSPGIYQRSDYNLSSLTGTTSYSKPTTKTDTPACATISTPLAPLQRLPEPDSLVLARITRITSRQALCSILLVLPNEGDDSIGTADSTSLQQALASGKSNHAAGEDPAGLDFSGVIRQQDVRLTGIDRVKMIECFRVGDLVKARVVSLGDSRSYYLTTAQNELGVIFATATKQSDVLPPSSSSTTTTRRPDPFLPASLNIGSASPSPSTSPSGVPGALRPLNWQEMVDPTTQRKEKRKVAKPEGV